MKKKHVFITFYIPVDGKSANTAKHDLATVIEQCKYLDEIKDLEIHQIWIPVKGQEAKVEIVAI